MPEKENIESSKGFSRLKEMALFNKEKHQNSSNNNQKLEKDFRDRPYSYSTDDIKNSEGKPPTSESDSHKVFSVDSENSTVPFQSQTCLPYSNDNTQWYLVGNRSQPVTVEDFADTSSESGHLYLKRKEPDLSKNLLTEEQSREIISMSETSNSKTNYFMEAFDELEDIDNYNQTKSPKVTKKIPLSMATSILSFDNSYDISKYELSQAKVAEVISYKPKNFREELSNNEENDCDKKNPLGFLNNIDKTGVFAHSDKRKSDIKKEIANENTYGRKEEKYPYNVDSEELKSRCHDSGPSFDSVQQKDRSSRIDSRANILEVALSSKRSTASNSFDPNETVLREYNDLISQDSQRKSYLFPRTFEQSSESIVAQHDRLSNVVPIKDMAFLGMLMTDSKSNANATLPVHISFTDHEARGNIEHETLVHGKASTTQKDNTSTDGSFNSVSQSSTRKTLFKSSDTIGASEKQSENKIIPFSSLHQYPPVNNHVSDEWSKRSSKASSLLHSPFMENILTHDLEKNPGNAIPKKKSPPSHSWTTFTFFMFCSLLVPPLFFLVFFGFFDLTHQAANAHYYREFYNTSLHKNYQKSFTHSQRIISLILGLLWSLIILAMIGIGFGVGLSRECRESCSS